MNAAAVDTFERALLELDSVIRSQAQRPHPTDRAVALREAERKFLAAVAPYRLQVAIATHLMEAKAAGFEKRENVSALVEFCIDLAHEAGVPRTELAALFNRKIGGGPVD